MGNTEAVPDARMLAGKTQVSVDAGAMFLGEFQKLSRGSRARLKDAYVWLDYFSVPQEWLDIANADTETQHIARQMHWNSTMAIRTTQDLHIRAIPFFVQACDVFVALVPPLRHHDTGLWCNYVSWFTRGWCRCEVWCRLLLGSAKMPVVVVCSPDQADFVQPWQWANGPPTQGQFTIETDSAVIAQIMQEALGHKLRVLEARKKWDMYRYFAARYEVLTGQPSRKRTLASFLADFKFDSFAAAVAETGMGPIACATLSGDAEMISFFSQAKALSNPLKGLLEVGIPNGYTPIYLAVRYAWHCPEVLQSLLETKANPDALDMPGIPVLALCVTVRDVVTLVENRADVNKRSAYIKVPILSLACNACAPLGVVAKLLEMGAHVNPAAVGGFGTAHPFAHLALTSAVNPHCLEVARLLVQAECNINLQCRAGGFWRLVEMASRCYLQLEAGALPARSRSVRCRVLASVFGEWTTTPLGFACLFGSEQMVHFLLEARADAELRNARGHTAFQLARSCSVLKLIQEHQKQVQHSG
ncbi:Fank1 [Symbiodinium sp. CCMP2456]|nr:Fank1 [Symbiodinium sp. CCMP2456]